MSDAELPGHALQKWVDEIRWQAQLGRNVAGPKRGFGCQCGVDFTSDDPYGEYELHQHEVRSRLGRRRWADRFLGGSAS